MLPLGRRPRGSVAERRWVRGKGRRQLLIAAPCATTSAKYGLAILLAGGRHHRLHPVLRSATHGWVCGEVWPVAA